MVGTILASCLVTPEAAAALFSLIERYGLPLVVIGILGWAYLTGKLVTPGQVAQLKEQIVMVTSLYERERLDRIAAESNLARFAGANAEVAEAVREVLTEIVKGDPYQERLTGSPRRGR